MNKKIKITQKAKKEIAKKFKKELTFQMKAKTKIAISVMYTYLDEGYFYISEIDKVKNFIKEGDICFFTLNAEKKDCIKYKKLSCIEELIFN